MPTRDWNETKARLAQEPDHEARIAAARKRVAARERDYFARLADLRRARGATQTALAAKAHLTQSGVARIERQADLYVSTLRRYIEAMGGSLEIRAIFPDQDVEVRFDDFAAVDRDNPDLSEPEAEVPASPSVPGLERAL